MNKIINFIKNEIVQLVLTLKNKENEKMKTNNEKICTQFTQKYTFII